MLELKELNFWEPVELAYSECVTSELKIKRSVFIGHLALCKTKENVRAFLDQVESKHKNATHNCWAYYCCSTEYCTEYCSDDGEPSGTAGKPILGVLKQSKMINLMVVVTRYFGGVKLGVRGLIDAYRQAAEEVVTKTERVLRIPSKKLIIHLPYDMIGEITRLLENYGTGTGTKTETETGINWQYNANVSVSAEIKLSFVQKVADLLQEFCERNLIFSWNWITDS